MSSNAVIFISVAAVLSAVSFLMDRDKTLAGFKKGWQMFRKLLLPFLNILIIVSIALYLIPPSAIDKYLGAGSGVGGFLIAAVVGSVTLIPAFISYPIAAGLLQQGTLTAALATDCRALGVNRVSLGVQSFSAELREALGRRAAVIRNALNFVAAIVIGLAIGVIL